MGWQWHQLDHMQIICTSLKIDNHSSTSSLNYFTCSNALPDAQPTVSKHWRRNSSMVRQHNIKLMNLHGRSRRQTHLVVSPSECLPSGYLQQRSWGQAMPSWLPRGWHTQTHNHPSLSTTSPACYQVTPTTEQLYSLLPHSIPGITRKVKVRFPWPNRACLAGVW